MQPILNVLVEGNGTTTPTGENVYDCDEEIELEATPDECYSFKN